MTQIRRRKGSPPEGVNAHVVLAFLLLKGLLLTDKERVNCFQAASSTDKILPAGSLNHAMVGPFPREIPRASVFKLGSL